MKVVRALMLVLAISVSAFAGEMECGRTEYMPNDRAGEIHTPKADAAANILLSLLQSVLPLF